MDFDEVIRRRHMVRSYLPDVVEADKVDRILDAARRARDSANRTGSW
jgi:nitroreductase